MRDIPPLPGGEYLVQQFAQQFTSESDSPARDGGPDGCGRVESRLRLARHDRVAALLHPHGRRLRKDLIKGGVILAVISPFVYPVLTRL